jgi:MFS family permease
MGGNLSQPAVQGNPYASRWRVLAAGFLCYGFDALDFMILALSLSLITQEFQLTLGQAGLLGTAGMLGVAASSVLVGWYSDNYGRKPALIYCVLVFGLFTAAVYWARGWWDIMTLRFLAGLGLGGAWGVITAFINETWPRDTRGRAASFAMSSWPMGYVVAATIARFVLPDYGWRTLFLVGGAPLVAALLVWAFVPESAQWQQDRAQRGRGEHIAVREIFAPGRRRITLLGTLAAGCMLTGYWGANTWLPTYLVRERGLSQQSMASFIIMLNLGMFAGYQLMGWVADRVGQRKSLLLCVFGATLMLPLYAAVRDPRLLYWTGPLLGLCFAYGGPLAAYLPMLYPTRVRSLGGGFCVDVGRGLAAFAPFAFGQIATHIGLSRSIAFSGLGFLLSGVVLLWMPETD